MARPVRIEYAGAVYHVICRGNNRQAIFRDEQDRSKYLEKLSFYCGDKSVNLLSYCLLGIYTSLTLDSPLQKETVKKWARTYFDPYSEELAL